MPKRELRPEEKILKALWGCSYSSEQLSEKFGIPPQTVSRACKSLEAFNLIRKAGGSWEICCLNKKTKKVLDQSNATFEDILSAYKRKLDVRNLFDGYKSYSGKRGSKEEWVAGARMVTASGSEYHKHLAVFGLTKFPTLKVLKEVRNALMKKAHPDVGGSHQDAALINEAYEKLVELIGK